MRGLNDSPTSPHISSPLRSMSDGTDRGPRTTFGGVDYSGKSSLSSSVDEGELPGFVVHVVDSRATLPAAARYAPSSTLTVDTQLESGATTSVVAGGQRTPRTPSQLSPRTIGRGSERSFVSRHRDSRRSMVTTSSGGDVRGPNGGGGGARGRRLRHDVFADAAAESKQLQLDISPIWLTFRDAALESAYIRWFYEDSGFVGGKVWSVLVVSLDIWFLTYYHKHFDFHTIFKSFEWGPMSVHIIFSALLGATLFYKPWARFREHIYIASLASHWPAVTIAIVTGKHPHSFIYFYIILCYFFCAFNAQARFIRVVWFLLLVPVVTLFAITFPTTYWGTHSYVEIVMWFYVVPPMILLRAFETISRKAFLTISASRDGIQSVKDQMAVTHTLLNNLFPKTATQSLINNAINGTRDQTNTYTAAVVLVTDIEGFTKWCGSTPPGTVIAELGSLFAKMDALSQTYAVEKVCLVGDSFVGAVFARRNEVQALLLGDIDDHDSLENVASASLSLSIRQRASASRVLTAIMFGLASLEISLPLSPATKRNLRMRIGVHIGDCVGSFVGCAPLTYDLFGATISEAKLLEQYGLAGHVHISKRCRDLISDIVSLDSAVESFKGSAKQAQHECLVGAVNLTELKQKNTAAMTASIRSESASSRRGSSDSSSSVSTTVRQAHRSELVSSALFRLIGVESGDLSDDNREASNSPAATPQVKDSLVDPDATLHPKDSVSEKSGHSSVNFKAEDQTKLNWMTLRFVSPKMEHRYAGSPQQLRLEAFAAKFWTIFLLSLVVCHVLFACLSSTNFINKFLTAAIAGVSVLYCAVTFQRYGEIAAELSADDINSNDNGSGGGAADGDPGAHSGKRKRGGSSKRYHNPSSRRARHWMSTSEYKALSVVVYNGIAIASSFLVADCTAAYDAIFYTAQVVGMYYLCALLATQFLLGFTFWQRNGLNVATMAIAYGMTGVRRLWYRDEVMIFEISYALAVFAVCCLSYFGEHATRSAFAAQYALSAVLRDAKSQHFDLTANALNLMLPSFAIDALVRDGNQMFLHANMGRINGSKDKKHRDAGAHAESSVDAAAATAAVPIRDDVAGSGDARSNSSSNATKNTTERRKSSVTQTRLMLEDFIATREQQHHHHQQQQQQQQQSASVSPQASGADSSSCSDTEMDGRSPSAKSVYSSSNDSVTAKQNIVWDYEFVAIAFIHFEVGTDDLHAEDVEAIDQTFRAIEDTLVDFDSVKIKTIGTTMLVVQGVDKKQSLVLEASARDAMTTEQLQQREADQERYRTKCVLSLAQAMRDVRGSVLANDWNQYSIGISAGPCFGAVIGTNSLRFDVLGSAVNLASRMQSSAANGQIQVTKTVADICLSHAMSVGPLPVREVKGLGFVETFELL